MAVLHPPRGSWVQGRALGLCPQVQAECDRWEGFTEYLGHRRRVTSPPSLGPSAPHRPAWSAWAAACGACWTGAMVGTGVGVLPCALELQAPGPGGASDNVPWTRAGPV